MWKLLRFLPAVVCAAALLSEAAAQAPGGTPDAGKAQPKDLSNSTIVTRMMAFDKNKDGKLTKDEVTDVRLHALFDRADTNKDGVVTKEELMALAAKMDAEFGQGGLTVDAVGVVATTMSSSAAESSPMPNRLVSVGAARSVRVAGTPSCRRISWSRAW